jgi:hypothetical protein
MMGIPSDGGMTTTYSILGGTRYNLLMGPLMNIMRMSLQKNLFSQVDSEGNQYVLMKEISDHRQDETAVPISDGGWITMKNVRRSRKKTTRGWQILVEWKEGGLDWIALKVLKESYPIEVAKYAKANKIAEEPAFAWWVNDVIRRRNRIISKIKS